MAYQERGLITSEMILLNLAVANFVMALTRGLPNSLYIFGLPNVFSDVHCGLLVYVSRVSRAMSICLTCFLSCFQCVTLLSSTATCMHVKVRLQVYTGPLIVLLLMVNATICMPPLLFAVSDTNVTYLEYAYRTNFCIVILPSYSSSLSQILTFFARDLVFMVGMSIASCAMLYTLYKHGKQVKGIRSSEQSRSVSAETRASKTISTLVAIYVLLFGIDSFIFFYQSTFTKAILTVTSDVRYFLSVCYSSVFPFVIIFLNQKVLRTIQRFNRDQLVNEKDSSQITVAQ
ncbi:olfactory receptor class A-like protein 1 [Ambystoma mexicanum]|uniref:olfactory receptor class A-like protein 1 n=1 Tax=Ambystoma mexicanum TaxID=8296 RepID=UPI0037E85412